MKGKLSAAAALAGGAVTLGAYRARKPKPLGVNYLDAPVKVLIVGGGSGGWLRQGNWRELLAGSGRWVWACWIG